MFCLCWINQRYFKLVQSLKEQLEISKLKHYHKIVKKTKTRLFNVAEPYHYLIKFTLSKAVKKAVEMAQLVETTAARLMASLQFPGPTWETDRGSCTSFSLLPRMYCSTHAHPIYPNNCKKNLSCEYTLIQFLFIYPFLLSCRKKKLQPKFSLLKKKVVFRTELGLLMTIFKRIHALKHTNQNRHIK